MSDDGRRDAAATALTLADYEELARDRFDRPVWDFIAGGAGQERTLAANTAAFDRLPLRPRVLVGAGPPDTRTTVLGRTWAAPIGVAPLGYHTLAHPDGEVATARAAGEAGLPLVVSTFAGRTLEDVAAATGAPCWLQVYCFQDRDATAGLVQRARRAGYDALVLTVDAPRLGRRLRDVRNDFRLPPAIVPANLTGEGFGSPGAHALGAFDPALDWTVVSWLHAAGGLPVLVKGVLTADAARRAVEAGADGVIVSNHGGRQLDGVPATLDVLPEVVEAVAGRCPVLLDGGVRRGGDVLRCLALGADAVLVGRPALHGLAVDGARGVRHVLRILTEELAVDMALAGVASVADAGPDLVRGAHVPLASQPTIRR